MKNRLKQTTATHKKRRKIERSPRFLRSRKTWLGKKRVRKHYSQETRAGVGGGEAILEKKQKTLVESEEKKSHANKKKGERIKEKKSGGT